MHSGLWLTEAMSRKKIILFIVEGITEKIALGLVLSRILTTNNVEFQVTNGDITTRNNASQATIKKDLGTVVSNFIKPVYRASDILEIVHLVDTDGVFVEDSAVLPHSTATDNSLLYTENGIYTNNISNICARNAQKRAILNLLLSTSSIYKGIPYRVYFFSCNLDHVLHDSCNLSKEEKTVKAEEFASRYADNLNAFVEFLKSPNIAVSSDYIGSWSYIKQNNNSLKRHSNFNLYLSLNVPDNNTP